jgi:hypothetical protein
VADNSTFKSSLNKTPFPDILATIDAYRVPGMLLVSHQGIEKKIYFEDEFITFAASNVNDDRLGEHLMRMGKIKQIDYDNSVDMLKKTKKRQGQIFVELGCLTAKDLFGAVKSQVREIVLSVFQWTEGDVTFIPGDFVKEETIKLRAKTSEIIIEGIKRIQNPRRLVSFIGGKDTVFKVRSDALTHLEAAGAGEEFYNIFNLIDGRKTLEQLVEESKKTGVETVRVVYTLIVLKVIEQVS